MNRNIRLCLAFVIAFLVAFGRFETTQRQDGVCTTDFPMMQIEYAFKNNGNNTIDIHCTAVALNHNWLLTLASCLFDDENPSRYRVQTSSQTIFVKKIYKNPTFNNERGTGYDLALLNVENRIVMDDESFPLLTSPEAYDDNNCIIVKRPRLRDGCPKDGFAYLRQSARSSQPAFCKHNAINLVDHDLVQCAQSSERSGDSGVCKEEVGAAFLCGQLGANSTRYRLRGISSWGDQRCSTSPYLFTKIDAYDGWIKSFIEEKK